MANVNIVTETDANVDARNQRDIDFVGGQRPSDFIFQSPQVSGGQSGNRLADGIKTAIGQRRQASGNLTSDAIMAGLRSHDDTRGGRRDIGGFDAALKAALESAPKQEHELVPTPESLRQTHGVTMEDGLTPYYLFAKDNPDHLVSTRYYKDDLWMGTDAEFFPDWWGPESRKMGAPTFKDWIAHKDKLKAQRQQENALPAENADIAGSEETPVERVERTPADSTAYIDLETGEEVETTPRRGQPVRPAQAPQAQPQQAQPAYIPAEPVSQQGNGASAPRSYYTTEDYLDALNQIGKDHPKTGKNAANSKNKADSDGPDIWGYGPRWAAIPEGVAKKGKDEIGKFLENREKPRWLPKFLRAKESDVPKADLDEMGRANDDLTFEKYGHNERLFLRKLSRARNAMLKRFFDASSLHVEGEFIETKTDKNGQTYARRSYGELTKAAIGAVKRVYNCSTRTVMQLVQLRAGLGVGYDGTIAHVDPDKFQLTEDQFYELCYDIVMSQKLNGHPLGSVKGQPNGSGVRDDSGRYVVVAKTRCFPLGYMPKQLLTDLMQDPSSPLHPSNSHLSADEIQDNIRKEWINVTYPTLCANTRGNLMFQARAIENMMRAFMMADGIDPSDAGIPDIYIRKTLMALEVEQQTMVDKEIRTANEIKQEKYKESMSRQYHRYRKSGSSRSSSGDDAGAIKSVASKRRRNRGGDIVGRISMLEQAAKAANIGVTISAVPENMVAEGMMSLANAMSNGIFSSLHGDVAKSYAFTDQLREMSESAEAIEARSVAESLYRIGGHDLMDAFFYKLDESDELYDPEHKENHLTKADLRRFLQTLGITGPNATISDRIRKMLKIEPGSEKGFLSNTARIVDALDDIMLSSNLFKERQSRQFVEMSMAEMARSSVHGRTAYTSSQVADWGLGKTGAEELIRSLLQTDAGREAFMTQGITGLGRKSPIEHGMRLIMSRNRVTEFLVRSMFDRFPEYGVNKLLQQFPFSNTFCFLTAYGIHSLGDFFSVDAMQRATDYVAGGRLSFVEGLRKNIMYDTVMGAEKLMIGAFYAGFLIFMGGVHPPEDKDKEGNWSEWVIGDPESGNALPIKWAWWMDDLSGVGLPLGMAWAICEQGGWSDESKRTATMVFINAMANLNNGGAVFDLIDLVNNFEEEVDSTFGLDIEGFEYDRDEWMMTLLEQGFWDIIGDLTPTFIGQLVPWCKDCIYKGDADAHTASRVYDVGEGSRYSMDEARSEYRTRRTDSYSDYVRRRSAQRNVLQALYYDAMIKGDDSATGYKYTEQPLDTMVDAYVWAMWNQFDIDMDPATSDIYGNADAQREYAESVLQHIASNYKNPYEAMLDGFALSTDARSVCINYCYSVINEAEREFYARAPELSYQEYMQAKGEFEATKDYYYGFLNDYFLNYDVIPARPPRYVKQKSDYETIYVDEDGNPMTWLDQYGPGVQNIARGALDLLGSVPIPGNFFTGSAVGDTQASAEHYAYGNIPSMLPFTSPRTKGKGYNFETIPSWIVLDENGNPVNDMETIYSNAANLTGAEGTSYANQNIQEAYFGGQGPHTTDLEEEQRIAPDEAPTIDRRNWRPMNEIAPEWMRDLDPDKFAEVLGIPSSVPGSEDAQSADDAKNSSQPRSSGGGSTYPSGGGYSYYYGGGGGYSEYTPRIYSHSGQVYGDRPSSMSTRSPYSPQRTYLNPGYYTSGSRKSYSRQQ